MVGCGPTATIVRNPQAAGAKGETFGYRKWIANEIDPDVVLIGIHGFCGASIDYDNLGSYFLAHQPRTGVYAYELRGQGSDPIQQRRGDIAQDHEPMQEKSCAYSARAWTSAWGLSSGHAAR